MLSLHDMTLMQDILVFPVGPFKYIADDEEKKRFPGSHPVLPQMITGLKSLNEFGKHSCQSRIFLYSHLPSSWLNWNYIYMHVCWHIVKLLTLIQPDARVSDWHALCSLFSDIPRIPDTSHPPLESSRYLLWDVGTSLCFLCLYDCFWVEALYGTEQCLFTLIHKHF